MLFGRQKEPVQLTLEGTCFVGQQILTERSNVRREWVVVELLFEGAEIVGVRVGLNEGAWPDSWSDKQLQEWGERNIPGNGPIQVSEGRGGCEFKSITRSSN